MQCHRSILCHHCNNEIILHKIKKIIKASIKLWKQQLVILQFFFEEILYSVYGKLSFVNVNCQLLTSILRQFTIHFRVRFYWRFIFHELFNEHLEKKLGLKKISLFYCQKNTYKDLVEKDNNFVPEFHATLYFIKPNYY